LKYSNSELVSEHPVLEEHEKKEVQYKKKEYETYSARF
jgi:DNA-directed RNA polymerase subunit H (RpoH/RPB5)